MAKTKLSQRTLTGLKSRAITAVGRAMPKPLLLKRIGAEWHEELVMSVYEAMKQLAIDLRNR